MKCVTFAR